MRLRIAAVALIFLVWAGLSARRVAVFRTERTLWADAVAKAPSKPRPVMDYGRALEMDGDLAGAEQQFRAVIPLTLDPRRGDKANRFALAAAETNIAHLYLKQDRIWEAIDVLNSTLQWWPGFTYAEYNLGRLMWAHGACEDGMRKIQMARAVDNFLSLPNEACVSSGDGQRLP